MTGSTKTKRPSGMGRVIVYYVVLAVLLFVAVVQVLSIGLIADLIDKKSKLR